MGKVSYSKLGLKINTEINTFTFADNTIEVLKYLPIEDKLDLIDITLQKAEINEVYNELLVDMYFHLNLIYLYSNISFTEKQKEDEFKLYNALESSGFLSQFLAAMDEEEYNACFEYLNQVKESRTAYQHSTAGIVKSMIVDLPSNAAAAASLLKDFDETQFENVLSLARNSGYQK